MKNISTQKRKSVSISFIIAMLALGALIALLVGCAETGAAASNRSATKIREATTCPQCKMVAVTAPQPMGPSFVYGRPFAGFASGYSWGGLGNGFGWSPTGFWHTAYEDKCPGCRGTLKTFFTEGKWNHKCTVCEQKPFTCPLEHRT